MAEGQDFWGPALLASAARASGPSPWFGFPLCGEVGRKGTRPPPSLPFDGWESTVNAELGLTASGCFVGARQGSSASFDAVGEKRINLGSSRQWNIIHH